MNIVRALDVALPEMPEQVVRRTPPKLDPRVIAKEHVEQGQSVVLVKMPGTDLVFRFAPIQWQLVKLFDGKRSFAEVARQFKVNTGTAISEEDVQELASFLQTDTQLLYKTAIERNITLQQELRSSRSKRKKSKTLDFSDIIIKTWDNADDYITWLYPRVRFLFTPWFVWTSIGMFVLMGWMWWDRFGEIWYDSFAFYNFTQKNGTDLIQFWFLFGAMAAIHETAHGLVGKHFGATTEKMGFSLMYFAPSFFCDATQVWVIGGKWARIATSIAGIWLDLVICFFATVVWWGTATGMSVHDWAYKIMMVTGIGVSILNLNPLIKLDGYLIFSEFVHEPALKESSTAYLSGWARRYIFRLPAEVPYVARRKRLFFVIYGILSGLYSYSLLSFLMVITYHILRSFNPEWAFVPALAIGFWVFRSRVKLLVNFMKMLYLDKKERVTAWLTPARVVVVGLAAAIVLFIPVWPDFDTARFILAPLNTSTLRTTMPATVANVSVHEGEKVAAGEQLALLRSLDVESRAANAGQELQQASARATQAAIHYADFGTAEQERQRRVEDQRVAASQLAELSVVTPIEGVVVTPHVSDLVGRSLDEGDLLFQIANTSQLRAEIYIPEFAMHEVHEGARVRLLVDGTFRPISAVLTQLAPVLDPTGGGLVAKDQLQGINPPRFYTGTAILQNEGELMPGMAGSAKILVARRSLAGLSYRFTREFAGRKFW
jgi:putative peptide zinc metalloprotease protein